MADQLAEMIRIYYPRVRGAFAYLVSDKGMVEDLCQQVFMRVWQKSDACRAKNERELWAFIRGVLQNVLREYIRSKRKPVAFRLEQQALMDLPARVSGAADMTCQQELSDIMRALVNEMLDPVDQQIVVGCYYLDMSHQELATLLQMPRKTVFNRHQRALKRLRREALRRGVSL